MIKTASAKAKGRKLQNHVLDRLLARFPWLKEGDVKSCSMGSGGVDIELSAIARKTFPVSIECKSTKKHPAVAEMKQARANSYGTTVPAVVWKPHGAAHSDCMITFTFEDFLDWYEQLAADKLGELEGKVNDLS